MTISSPRRALGSVPVSRGEVVFWPRTAQCSVLCFAVLISPLSRAAPLGEKGRSSTTRRASRRRPSTPGWPSYQLLVTRQQSELRGIGWYLTFFTEIEESQHSQKEILKHFHKEVCRVYSEKYLKPGEKMPNCPWWWNYVLIPARLKMFC